MIDLSVIVCTEALRTDCLRRVLDALRSQTFDKSRWELVLVSNETSKHAQSSLDISWHPNARHIFEKNFNVASGQRRGIRESSAALLVFIDDDAVLELDYLDETIKISREWPRLGVWGSGGTRLEFEIEPSAHVKEIASRVSLRNTKIPRWSNVFNCVESAPLGAGLCVRADVARAYNRLSEQSFVYMSNRVEGIHSSVASDEISYVACSLRSGMGIFPGLRLTRLIPKDLGTRGYFIKLRELQSVSRSLLIYKWQDAIPANPLSPAGFLSAIKNIFLSHGIERRVSFADLKAAFKARRIIAANQSKI